MERYISFEQSTTTMTLKKEERTGKLIFRYMVPVGSKEYPIEVEIRFPHELSDAVATEIKRLFWPLMPVVEKINMPREPEMEVEIEPEHVGKIEVEEKAPRKTRTMRRK